MSWLSSFKITLSCSTRYAAIRPLAQTQHLRPSFIRSCLMSHAPSMLRIYSLIASSTFLAKANTVLAERWSIRAELTSRPAILAPSMAAPRKSAPEASASLRFAAERFASRNFANSRFARERLAPVRLAPVGSRI